MDQNIPVPEPSNFLRVLHQMCEAKKRNLFYLAAFGRTLNLIALENAKEPGKHGLQADMIVNVVQAWGDDEDDGWMGGFVVELRDGRCVYIESYADDANWRLHAGVSTMPVAAGRDLPELPPTTTLRALQRRQLIFVPVILDVDAKSWWAQQIRWAQLQEDSPVVFPPDYPHTDFTTPLGQRVSINPNDPSVTPPHRNVREGNRKNDRASISPAHQ